MNNYPERVKEGERTTITFLESEEFATVRTRNRRLKQQLEKAAQRSPLVYRKSDDGTVVVYELPKDFIKIKAHDLGKSDPLKNPDGSDLGRSEPVFDDEGNEYPGWRWFS